MIRIDGAWGVWGTAESPDKGLFRSGVPRHVEDTRDLSRCEEFEASLWGDLWYLYDMIDCDKPVGKCYIMIWGLTDIEIL